MKILYSGPLRAWSTTEARMKALRALGHEVVPVDECRFLERGPRPVQVLQRHLLVGPGPARYNRALVRATEATRPDLVWIDQGGQVRRQTVAALRATGARVLHYTSDSFAHRTYWFRHYFEALDLYDVHVITNELNRPFLEDRGVSRIVMSEFAYDPDLHRPPPLNGDDRRRDGSAAIFVGHWEPVSESLVLALREAGIDVRVHGPGWHRARTLHDRRSIRPLHGTDYVAALASAQLCLCFLSKPNRNQSAGRTFEIPAVGGFLLSERTADQQTYFTEGTEAEYFSGRDELIDKARFYLEHPESRTAVAAAGHRRCTMSPYTHTDRCRQILQSLS